MKKISWLLICVMIVLSMASVCFASGIGKTVVRMSE